MLSFIQKSINLPESWRSYRKNAPTTSIDCLPHELLEKIGAQCTARDFGAVSKPWNKIFRVQQKLVLLNEKDKLSDCFAERFPYVRTVVCQFPTYEQISDIQKKDLHPQTFIKMTENRGIMHGDLVQRSFCKELYNEDMNLALSVDFFQKFMKVILHPSSLSSISPNDVDYIELAKTLVKNNIDNFRFVGEELQVNSEFIKFALDLGISALNRKYTKRNKNYSNEASHCLVCCLLFAGLELRNDKEFILDLCKVDVVALYFASDELKSNGEFVYKACMIDRLAFYFANTEIKLHKKFILLNFLQTIRVPNFAIKIILPIAYSKFSELLISVFYYTGLFLKLILELPFNFLKFNARIIKALARIIEALVLKFFSFC